MAKYERIIQNTYEKFPETIFNYQKLFTGREIYVSNKTYLDLLKFLGLDHDLVSITICNRATETRIIRSYRVPDYVAYAVKR